MMSGLGISITFHVFALCAEGVSEHSLGILTVERVGIEIASAAPAIIFPGAVVIPNRTGVLTGLSIARALELTFVGLVLLANLAGMPTNDTRCRDIGRAVIAAFLEQAFGVATH